MQKLKRIMNELGNRGDKQSIKEEQLTLSSLEAELKRTRKIRGSEWNLNNLDQMGRFVPIECPKQKWHSDVRCFNYQ